LGQGRTSGPSICAHRRYPRGRGSLILYTGLRFARTFKRENLNVSESDLPPNRFLNRELSWLEFNQRVLAHSEDPELPLLERAKFLAITGANLDEFVMVRIGGLKMQYQRNPMVRDPAGLTIGEQLHAVSERCHHLQSDQYRILNELLEPMLADAGNPPAEPRERWPACTPGRRPMVSE
jgi:hypothetical protein